MTVRELIAELSKYPPDSDVEVETRSDIASIVDITDRNIGLGFVRIRCEGWDDLSKDDDDIDSDFTCGGCGETNGCACDAEPDDEE